MEKHSNDSSPASPEFLGAGWFDPIEVAIRDRVRGFIEDLVDAELDEALGRSRYQRARSRQMWQAEQPAIGMGGGTRQLLGSFGPVTISVPRARLNNADGTSREWHSEALPRYARMTKQVEALIAGAYLSGTNTRRVRRALGALFKGAVGKDVVSRTWRKVQTDWEAWCRRSLADEDVVRLILDGTVVQGAARPQGDVDLVAGGAGHSARWAEGAAGGAQHGRRERGGLARSARRSGLAWFAGAELRHHRWCGGTGEGARPGVARRTGAALHRAQAPQPVWRTLLNVCMRRSRPTTTT